MNIGLIKIILWFGVVALFGGLFLHLYEFRTDGPARAERWITKDIQEGVFKQPKPERQELPERPYAPVKGMFYALNWTGEIPPPPPVVEEKPTTKPVVLATPADKLVEVLFIQQDTSDAERSLAAVKYIGKLAGYQSRMKEDAHVIRIGDTLPEDFDYWELVAIDAAEGLTFRCTTPDAFDNEPEDVTVAPPKPISGEIPTADGGVVVRPERNAIPTMSDEDRVEFFRDWPQRTTSIRRNEYRVGTEDSARIQNDYLDILSNEVNHRRWRNPKTGQYEGIEIVSIAADSVAGNFGIRSGDVIKSVNGHPVKSTNEAITFAKNNADYYSVWEVLVWNAGTERTVTIETPPNNGGQ